MNTRLNNRIPTRLMGLAVLLGAVLTACYYLSTHDVAHSWRQFQLGHPVHPPPHRPVAAEPAALRDARSAAGGLLRLVRLLGLIALALAALTAASRAYWRRRRAREVRRCELRLGREDQADPFEVQKSFDGISGLIQARWYERAWRGQDSLVPELHKVADGTVRLTFAGQGPTFDPLRGALKALYPDTSLEPVTGAPQHLRYVVRLKKAREHILRIQTVRDYQHSFSEALIAAIAELPGPTSV